MFEKPQTLAQGARQTNANGTRQATSQVTVLAHGSALEGKIRTAGPLHVDGAVCGTLTCEGPLSVGATGLILGELHVQSLSANGRVSGIVFVRHHLQVREHGRLCGHARYESLEIERGGVVDGTTNRMNGVPTLVDAGDDDDEYEAAQ